MRAIAISGIVSTAAIANTASSATAPTPATMSPVGQSSAESKSTYSPTVVPPVGLHFGVPAEIYHAWPALNNSTLTKLEQSSPEHVLADRKNPRPRTAQMRFGDAYHLCVLQPELFDRYYMVAGPCCADTKGGVPCKNMGAVRRAVAGAAEPQWFCNVKGHDPMAGAPFDGDHVISQSDWDTMRAMRERLMSDPIAGPLLRQRGPVEVSAIFTDEATGQVCKLRIDKILVEMCSILDLKTTVCANRPQFVRAIKRYGYYRQAGFYVPGVMRAEPELAINKFIFVAQEKKYPYTPGVYRLGERSIAKGKMELAPLVRQYAACAKRELWPGYTFRPAVDGEQQTDWSAGGEYAVQDIELEEWDLRDIPLEIEAE